MAYTPPSAGLQFNFETTTSQVTLVVGEGIFSVGVLPAANGIAPVFGFSAGIKFSFRAEASGTVPPAGVLSTFVRVSVIGEGGGCPQGSVNTAFDVGVSAQGAAAVFCSAACAPPFTLSCDTVLPVLGTVSALPFFSFIASARVTVLGSAAAATPLAALSHGVFPYSATVGVPAGFSVDVIGGVGIAGDVQAAPGFAFDATAAYGSTGAASITTPFGEKLLVVGHGVSSAPIGVVSSAATTVFGKTAAATPFVMNAAGGVVLRLCAEFDAALSAQAMGHATVRSCATVAAQIGVYSTAVTAVAGASSVEVGVRISSGSTGAALGRSRYTLPARVYSEAVRGVSGAAKVTAFTPVSSHAAVGRAGNVACKLGFQSFLQGTSGVSGDAVVESVFTANGDGQYVAAFSGVAAFALPTRLLASGWRKPDDFPGDFVLTCRQDRIVRT